jgi:hypothetical protein
MDQRSCLRLETTTGKHRENTGRYRYRQLLSEYNSNYSGNKSKNCIFRKMHSSGHRDSGILPNLKTPAHERKQLPETRDNPQNGREFWQVIHHLKD